MNLRFLRPRIVMPRFSRDPLAWLALGGGAGASPIAPGTAGTLVAVPIHLLLLLLPNGLHLVAVLLACIAGIWICAAGCRYLGRHDPPAVVWDEIAAFLLLAWALPQGFWWWVSAFALFRLFDIVKPWPIRDLDRKVPGGLGVMADDLLAAGYAWLLLQVPLLLF